MQYIKGASMITPSEILEYHILGFEEKISLIAPEDGLDLSHEDSIDGRGLYIAPGLIDVHVHGSSGKDVMDGMLESFVSMSSGIAKNGVTAFLATTTTMEWEAISHALSAVRVAMMGELPGAKLLGAHLEGPFINPKFKGAQNAEYILSPDWDRLEAYRDVIRMVTLAPEMKGAKELIGKLKEQGILTSMGHTAASFEEAMSAIDAGVFHCTHLFNAMTGVHHRNPGAAAAALSSDIYCELIADNIHVHPGLFELVRKAKGEDRIILVTDSMEAGGLEDGTYSLGGQPVSVKNGAARLQDGTLAGSVLELNRGVCNFYRSTDAQLQEAFNMASLNPARELGIDDEKGSLSIGKDADFFLMDKDFNVKATYVKGQCVYREAD